ncbi:hypothetical protein HZS_6753 [Henneguya salminicola]|nr:hypothetical protein HZS_6753 [Henneguya salminicola]
MIRQRINLPLTILSDAAHINIPEQYKITNVYGTAFKVGGNQDHTKIMKQRGQSLRCFRLLHLLKKIILFECTKHWKNIYASMGTFIGRHHRTGRSQSLFSIRLCNQSEGTERGISRTNNKVEG